MKSRKKEKSFMVIFTPKVCSLSIIKFESFVFDRLFHWFNNKSKINHCKLPLFSLVIPILKSDADYQSTPNRYRKSALKLTFNIYSFKNTDINVLKFIW